MDLSDWLSDGPLEHNIRAAGNDQQRTVWDQWGVLIIVLTVIGALLLIVAITLIVVYCCVKKKTKSSSYIDQWKTPAKQYKSKDDILWPEDEFGWPTNSGSYNIYPVQPDQPRKMAPSAQMYDYQFQKNQNSLKPNLCNGEQVNSNRTSFSSVGSDLDLTEKTSKTLIYEFPRTNPEGNLEVTNPLFNTNADLSLEKNDHHSSIDSVKLH